MNDVQMASFKIISAVGTAKSYYIEAIRFSENGEFEKAQENMEKGKESYKEGHEVHFKLIQEEAGGGLLSSWFMLKTNSCQQKLFNF